MLHVNWKATGQGEVVAAYKAVRAEQEAVNKEAARSQKVYTEQEKAVMRATRSAETAMKRWRKEQEDVYKAGQRGLRQLEQQAAADRRAAEEINRKAEATRRAMQAERERTLSRRNEFQTSQNDLEAARRSDALRGAILRRAGAERQLTRELQARNAATTSSRDDADLRRQRALRDAILSRAKAQRQSNSAMRAEASQVVSRNRTALESYNIAMARTNRLHQSGYLSTQQLAREQRRLRKELDATSQAQRAAFGPGATAGIRNLAITVFGAHQAIATLRSQISEIRAEATARSETQLTAAAARRGLKFNIGSATPEQQREVLSAADELAPRLRLPQQRVDSAIKSAISAAPTVDRGVRFTTTALEVLKDVEGVEEFTGGLLDIAQALDTDDPKVAFGFTSRALRRSRATDARKFSQNVPRVIITGKSLGLSPAESTALVNALSVSSADPFLEVSRTSSINLMERLGGFFDRDRVSSLGIEEDEIDETREQLLSLLKKPELAKEFTDTVGFRAAGSGGIRGLLEGLSGQARETFDLTFRDLSVGEDAFRDSANRALKFLNTGRFEAAAEVSRSITSADERSAFASPELIGEDLRMKLVQTIRRSRLASLQEGPDFLGNIGATPAAIGAEIFATAGITLDPLEAAEIAEREANLTSRPMSRRGEWSRPMRDPQASAEQVAILRDMAANLRRSVQIAEQSRSSSTQGE